MNKYLEALKSLEPIFMDYVYTNAKDWESIRLLQELVDKATPKKVIKWLNDRSMACCPICHTAEYAEEMPKHCRYCGQAIDWIQDDNPHR